MLPSGRYLVRVLVALLLGSGVGIVVRFLAFSAAAVSLKMLGGLAPLLLALFPGLDPVYTRAAIQTATDLQLRGLAVAGPPGVWLHALLPSLVLEPSTAHWALVRVVLQPDSPVLARLVAAGIAHATVLLVGLLGVMLGVRRHRPGGVLVGVAIQLQVALGILSALPSARELDATGITFGANALLPLLVSRGMALQDILLRLSLPIVTGVLVAAAVALAYIPAALVVARFPGRRRASISSAFGIVLATACSAALLQAGSPPAPTTHASALRIAQTRPAAARSVPVATRAAINFDRWFDDPLAQTAGPSHVEVKQTAAGFTYLVNGQPQVIKGMGLNTQYAQQLSPADRATQVDADMAALQALGVNTVLGWDPREFDGVLLDAAQRHGIGVVMPFDIDPNTDFTDPGIRDQLTHDVLAWVTRYRAHPALRMWGIGNEVLHKIVHPAWVGPQDPRQEKEAEAFSDWLVQTADAVHAADPDHPVTYRSAEDAFVDWVAAAMQRDGGGERPWFVWGTNCYQPYLNEILNGWPDSGMPTAIWVSEFAPGGLAVPDRPDGFDTMWGYIRAHPQWVLGGVVYAWTRNGPEGVDRNFGLTDDGVPVDGRSLDALNGLFHQD